MRRPGRAQSGFTLVELMVVVAVIMTIVALAIPSFLTSRMRANEGTAAANLTAVRNGCQTFYTQANPHVYPTAMTDLIAPTSNPPYIDPVLAAGQRQGYDFFYSNPDAEHFTLLARPVVYGRTGNKNYYADETGIITATTLDQAAGPSDPQVQ